MFSGRMTRAGVGWLCPSRRGLLWLLAILLPAMIITATHGGTEGLRDSPIGRLAASAATGVMTPLETGLPEGVEHLQDLFRVTADDGRRLSIDGWTDSAHWDPTREKTFFIGMRLYKRFISYDALQNRWQELGWAGEAPPKLEKFGHVYGRTALDYRRGHYYWHVPGELYRYDIDRRQWSSHAVRRLAAEIAMEWHEALDRLVALDRGGKIYVLQDGQFEPYGQAGVDGYHSVGRYNRTRREMLFAGGNNSPHSLTAIDENGRIRQFDPAPFAISIKNVSLTYDPVGGNYLFFLREQRMLYEFDPDRGRWRLVREWKAEEWPFGEFGFYTPVVIDDLGVILFQSETGNRIYRHTTTNSPS